MVEHGALCDDLSFDVVGYGVLGAYGLAHARTNAAIIAGRLGAIGGGHCERYLTAGV